MNSYIRPRRPPTKREFIACEILLWAQVIGVASIIGVLIYAVLR